MVSQEIGQDNIGLAVNFELETYRGLPVRELCMGAPVFALWLRMSPGQRVTLLSAVGKKGATVPLADLAPGSIAESVALIRGVPDDFEPDLPNIAEALRAIKVTGGVLAQGSGAKVVDLGLQQGDSQLWKFTGPF